MSATETTFGREWDKGHFVAHSIGGAVDRAEVIVFVQLRAESGMVGGRKALSGDGSLRETNPGTFCFNRSICDDQTARPAFVELVLIKGDGELWMECFANLKIHDRLRWHYGGDG